MQMTLREYINLVGYVIVEKNTNSHDYPIGSKVTFDLATMGWQLDQDLDDLESSFRGKKANGTFGNNIMFSDVTFLPAKELYKNRCETLAMELEVIQKKIETFKFAAEEQEALGEDAKVLKISDLVKLACKKGKEDLVDLILMYIN
jgi:hypothetical protein